MAEFVDEDLGGAHFERVSLRNASMRLVDLSNAEIRGWPQLESFPLRQCLLIVLNEEWAHRIYAERDLAVLDSAAPSH